MGEVAAVATAVTALIGFIFWFVKRSAAKTDDPRTQIQKERDENRKAIVDGTAPDLLLDRIARLRPPKGPSA